MLSSKNKEAIKYKNYRKVDIIGIEKIPSHWEVLPLFSLAQTKSITNNVDKELLSVYLEKGVIRFSEVNEKRTNATSEDLSKYQLVNPGDLVLNNQQAWRGSVGVSCYTGIVSPAYIVLNLNSKLNPNYANYYFRNTTMVSQYLVCSKGVGTIQRNLYWPCLKRVPVCVPPLEEQITIANFLDKKITLIDKSISIKEKQIELLKERRKLLISRAVTNGIDPNVKKKDSGVEWIGEIPEHWRIKKLKYLVEVINSKVISKKVQYKYIGMENIESWSGKYIETDAEVDGIANRFFSGNVLFGKLRPYLAKAFLANNDGICSSEFLVFKCKLEIRNSYLKEILLSLNFISLVDSSTYGSKMPRANIDFIGNQFLPIPSLSEQDNIIDYIKGIHLKIDKLILQKEESIARIKDYKTILIENLVTGKVIIK